VRSTPSRAGVTLNGRWRGRTPLTLQNLPFGNYIVRVVQKGYRVARENVALTSRAASRTLDVRLERAGRAPAVAAAPTAGSGSTTPPRGPVQPATFTGELFVDSRPQGANVLLDGKLVGRTPLRLPTVQIGTHVVRIELAEHRPWFSTTRITAGEVSRVTGSLERFQ
jgi:hypothetical protein